MVEIMPKIQGCETVRQCDCTVYKDCPPREIKGDLWGFMVCAVNCSNYTHGFMYDWNNGMCKCRTDWFVPTLWRRK